MEKSFLNFVGTPIALWGRVVINGFQTPKKLAITTNRSHPNLEESFMASGEKIIGIDLGTTNSVVAVMEGNEVKVEAPFLIVFIHNYCTDYLAY